MANRRSQLNYASVSTEGGLLPPDLLDKVALLNPSIGGMKAADYGLADSGRLDTAISQAWQAIQTHYASFQRTMQMVDREGGSGTSETRAWVQQVLRELGYRELRYVQAAETIDGRSFLVSHRAGDADNASPIHVATFQQRLDDRTGRTGGGEQRSPQALVQGYLNASDHLWGMVTNGLVFRLLRENRQIDRILRVDFDLAGMLESEAFSEFRLFWLVLHRSRFVQPGEANATAWLEQWSQHAASEGTRALTGLSEGVEKAIQSLGQGLLSHPQNAALRQDLESGHLTIDAYYSQLLRMVYRFLFLMVAEERHLLFTEETDKNVLERYRKHYSIERLREEAARVRNREKHYDDLWRGLLVTFDAMRYPNEAELFGLKPLGGGLFGDGSCPDVADNAAPGTHGTDKTAGRPLISNAALLDAVEAISEITRDGITRRINYRDLDVEELGSVYEGLLEHQPSLEPEANGTYRFTFAFSGDRKSTGSYYTPGSLVQELLNSALDPVIDAAVANMATLEDARKALLALNVVDPACGSGHFLLGAARRIGRRLAEVEVGPQREPELYQIRRGVRDAIRHCIYGVDKNPLAIDLCKTALWIESHEPGAPIGFLDNHIKRGDSLVGVYDLDVLNTGIPDEAFNAITGDDKKLAADLKKRNKAERPKATDVFGGARTTSLQAGLFDADDQQDLMKALGAQLQHIEQMPEDTLEQVRSKTAAYQKALERDDWHEMTIAADLWTHAFFAPKNKENLGRIPTSKTVRDAALKGSKSVRADLIGDATAAAVDIGYFHWELQFPEVFRNGGFDTVLGNPPWERVKLQEKEFFATRDESIATAPNKAARDRLINQLAGENPMLMQEFRAAQHTAEAASLFMRTSERYPLTGRGDVNLYSVFAEHFRNLTGTHGRAGIIVPTGIATDDTNKFFFGDLVTNGSIGALYDFENRKAIFEGVHRSYKFSLLVMTGREAYAEQFRAGFFLMDPLEIHDPEKTFLLGPDDIALVNPNTKTVPIFRSSRDAELTKAIYERAPVLVNEELGDEGNPWGVKFKTLFHMSNDSHLFRTREELEADGAALGADGRFRKLSHEWLPLYEAKLMHQFDHRYAKYAPDGKVADISPSEHADPNIGMTAQYWLDHKEVERRALQSGYYSNEYLMLYRLITRATDVRTTISSFTPFAASNNSIGVILNDQEHRLHAALLANLNSFPLDFVSRQKLGGINFSFFMFKQLAILPPETYTEDLLNEIMPRVLELTYTAHDMTPFARDFGYQGEPFIWDEERRAQLRADLDGLYAHLYGISREDFAYILDTFPIVRRKDIAAFGEYRTKRLCLDAYDYYAPETLRELEGEVRDIEIAFRRSIDSALGGDVDALPSHLRNKMREEMEKYGKDPQSASLRDLLSYSYFLDLEKIIRSEPVWLELGERFESKRQFEKRFGAVSKIRNPLAHARTVSGEERREGEEAVAWLKDRLHLVQV